MAQSFVNDFASAQNMPISRLRAVQKCRHTKTAGNSGSALACGSLGIATLEAFDYAQGEGMTLNSRSAQKLAAFSAPAGQAAARYDFRCPPSSVWQTSLRFAKWI